MKIPRDLDAAVLIKSLKRIGYEQTRQVGSHIRLTIMIKEKEFHLTIPNHNPIKVGTLNNILKDLSNQLEISKEDLIQKLQL
jgi:predicted RNA binding protein YcfA (HicA-like mRNA interferase family)